MKKYILLISISLYWFEFSLSQQVLQKSETGFICLASNTKKEVRIDAYKIKMGKIIDSFTNGSFEDFKKKDYILYPMYIKALSNNFRYSFYKNEFPILDKYGNLKKVIRKDTFGIKTSIESRRATFLKNNKNIYIQTEDTLLNGGFYYYTAYFFDSKKRIKSEKFSSSSSNHFLENDSLNFSDDLIYEETKFIYKNNGLLDRIIYYNENQKGLLEISSVQRFVYKKNLILKSELLNYDNSIFDKLIFIYNYF